MTEKERLEKEIQESETKVLNLKNFLASKDYQTIREMQGGQPMDENTKNECAEARLGINSLESIIEKDKQELQMLEDENTHHQESDLQSL